ncbi:MAG: hypothetical protein K2I71_04065 [Helicobacter sp.]|nr:hypothetical protein [Helicobacter sp.]
MQNQNISFPCDKLIKLVDKGLIKDEESLLKQNRILNQENTQKEFNVRNFHNSATETIPQSNQSTKDFKAKLKEFNTKNKNNTQTKERELKR